MTEKDWKQLSTKIVHENNYFRVREDAVTRPDGKPGTYFVIEAPPGVTIVALTEKNEIYFVLLHRYTTGVLAWELPAGGVEGNNLLEAAQRELQEETGLTARDWKEIGLVQLFNGSTNKIQHIFLA